MTATRFTSPFVLDPVSAYDLLAPQYARIADRRRPYLERVEQQIIAVLTNSARSLLDVGAGDGTRSARIAQTCGVSRLVLLEPSPAMRGSGVPGSEIWRLRAEELSTVQDGFDAITCLWNVLGHIDPAQARAEVLRQLGRLLKQGGLAFVDVNHRYNASEYGALRTGARFLRDRIRPGERNGDVLAHWDVAGERCSTRGHVFTDREFRRLSRSAGLEIRKKVVIDYRTGKLRHWSFCGNFLYVLGKASST